MTNENSTTAENNASYTAQKLLSKADITLNWFLALVSFMFINLLSKIGVFIGFDLSNDLMPNGIVFEVLAFMLHLSIFLFVMWALKLILKCNVAASSFYINSSEDNK